MARKVVWTRRALRNFNRIIDYLEEEWSQKVTTDFVRKSYKIIELLRTYPQLGSLENQEKDIYGFLITSHNRLFYRFSEEEIILLNFFDTRQGVKQSRF
jgi:plasmid stabilization system protein ParE